MISIVIPVYKAEQYLCRCIESIQRQTYRDIEIILIDDGSPDRCGEICDQYAAQDNRIVVVHKANQGAAAARNDGLDIARGELIGFVDSDDCIHERMFEMLYTELREKNADMAICGSKTVTTMPSSIETIELKSGIEMNDSQLWNEVFKNLNNAVWNKLYKRELIGELRFPVNQHHGEDLLFNLQYIQKCRKAVKIEAPLYLYLKREGSVTMSGFSSKKVMEITSKDIAKEIIGHCRPELMNIAELYCFRARLNVIRSIVKARVEIQNIDILEQCREYVRENYRTVRIGLGFKEKVEYFLYMYARAVHRWVICKFF